MQQTTPLSDERINWTLGLKALAVAISLAGVSAGSGSQLPMYGAVLVAGWAMVKPLRLASWAFSPRLLRFAGQLAIRTGVLAAAAFVLSFAINSRLPVLATLGSVLFLALLCGTAVLMARAARAPLQKAAPGVWARCSSGVAGVRAQAAVVWGSVIGK